MKLMLVINNLKTAAGKLAIRLLVKVANKLAPIQETIYKTAIMLFLLAITLAITEIFFLESIILGIITAFVVGLLKKNIDNYAEEQTEKKELPK
jgi:hypothetical protein